MATESFSAASTIDEEIASLKKRAKQLRADIKTHVSTLASAYAPEELPTNLRDAITQQQAHAQESLWRIGAGVTAFRVEDPDPRAVDGGSVLGIRFEIMRSGRFLQPYVVLLNRPYGTEDNSEAEENVLKTYLRVHRHTIPNCIPIGGLAARYLPPPTVIDATSDEDVLVKRRTQNLSLFVKELRQRLVAYHNRLGAVADMRKAAGLGADDKESTEKSKKDASDTQQAKESSEGDEGPEDSVEESGPPRILEISLADAEAKQIKIDWSNGDVCRLVVDDGGEIEKCVMYGAQGRDMPAAREFLQRITRVERLPESIRRKRGLEPA
ncbi:hypothetical protein BR93DRAFT_563745 [Coniochaeta sp. PMI_546]|nr:hypothetical protein BR93DRAFT_563745 [Coniochaeta sp. PMI_546]